MKKVLVISATLAALNFASNAALAADMPVKTPAPVPVANLWTGCYVAAGGGYGMWNQDMTVVAAPVNPDNPINAFVGPTQNSGSGRGWFGTVQAGCDLQVSNVVIGAFADYDFGNIKAPAALFDGRADLTLNLSGSERQRSAWAAGARIGWLPFDRLLTYVSGGYTEVRYDQIDLSAVLGRPVFNITGDPIAASALNQVIPTRTYRGWFLGGGYEYYLGLPGLFWKTEYRFAEYRADGIGTISSIPLFAQNGVFLGTFGESINARKYVQAIRTELVWRFTPVPVGY